METTLRLDGWEVNIWTDRIDVTSLTPYRDPKWQYTDSHGHEHTTEPQTYAWVQDEPDYVVMEDGYPEEYAGSGHWECPICHEHLTPGLTSDMARRYITGPTTATATAPDGRLIYLSADDVARLHGAGSGGAVVAVLESLI